MSAKLIDREIRTVALLVNPAAGGGRVGAVADRAEARLRGHGITVTRLIGTSAQESLE